ncbi:MAG: hypothetical protein PHG08_01150 [Bacilli bacterium]|nr:hypothetical protein [Bacilli bacterium]
MNNKKYSVKITGTNKKGFQYIIYKDESLVEVENVTGFKLLSDVWVAMQKSVNKLLNEVSNG